MKNFHIHYSNTNIPAKKINAKVILPNINPINNSYNNLQATCNTNRFDTRE
jgi:hypothetical protein